MAIAVACKSAFRPLFLNFAVKHRAAPTPTDLHRQRVAARVAAVTCSPPWATAVTPAAIAMRIDPAQPTFESALRDRGIYPPPADAGPDRLPRIGAVRMRRCDACGRTVPPNNVARHRLVQVCDDCRIEPANAADHDEAGVARVPGVHPGVLVEGQQDDVEKQQQNARDRLHALGLTDPEIKVLAFVIEGYSSRRIALFLARSQTFVCKLQRSAERKLSRSGLRAERVQFSPESAGPALKMRSIDPAKLVSMTSRNF